MVGYIIVYVTPCDILHLVHEDSDISDREHLETMPFNPWGTVCLLVAVAALSIAAGSRGLIAHVMVP
jgi:hypothetical protein